MMAKEDIEKPKGKKGKGGMVLIIGIPKPKKGQIKKARRLGGAGFDAGRRRGLHDILRGKNGKRKFMGILDKRRIDPERFNAMLRQRHNVSIDDLADMEHPPAGLNLQNLLDEQAEMGAKGRRFQSQKRGLMNPELFQGKGAFSRYTPEMVESVINSPGFKGGDDAIQEVKDRLKGQERSRPKESYRDRQDRLSEQERMDEEVAEVRGDENYEDPDDAHRRRFRERGIGELTEEEMGRDDAEGLRYPSADRLRQEAEMMGRLLTARGASDRTIEDAMQAIMEGRKPTAQEIGEDEDAAPMSGGGHARGYEGGGLEPTELMHVSVDDLERLAQKAERGEEIEEDEKKALLEMVHEFGLPGRGDSGDSAEEEDKAFREKYGMPLYADPDDLARQGFYYDDDEKIPFRFGAAYHDDLFSSKKGQKNHGLARFIRDMTEHAGRYMRGEVPSENVYARQPGAGRPMRQESMEDEPMRNIDFNKPGHNPRQRAETTLQNIRYTGAEVDPDPLPGQRTAGGARVTSRGGGQTTMARPRRNVEQEFDQPIDAAMQRFLSPQEEDAELRARGQDILTSFDDPRDVMSAALSLLKGE